MTLSVGVHCLQRMNSTCYGDASTFSEHIYAFQRKNLKNFGTWSLYYYYDPKGIFTFYAPTQEYSKNSKNTSTRSLKALLVNLQSIQATFGEEMQS